MREVAGRPTRIGAESGRAAPMRGSASPRGTRAPDVVRAARSARKPIAGTGYESSGQGKDDG
jgi:hypothetical protein